jgi:CBS domain containing-hemolysin-like protein
VTATLLLLASLALILICGLFVAAEFSFITVSRATVEKAAADGDRRAAGLLVALKSLSTQLSGAQVGITITNLAIGFLAEPAIAELVRGPLASMGLPNAAARSVSIALALVLATALTMIMGELVPKNLAIARPLQTAGAVQGFMRAATTSIHPIIVFFNGTANALLRLLGVEPQEELASARSAEELAGLVAHSAHEGAFADETAELVQRSLEFGDRRARDVMTPRTRMRTLDRDATVADVITASQQTGYSRFPIISEDPSDDEIMGVTHVRQALAVPFDRRATVPVMAIARKASAVPESLELDALLDRLRLDGQQLALVVDEFGATAGLVTLEDLLEELVGDVRDEHDQQATPTGRQDGDGRWVLSGLLRLDEVEDLTDIELPEDRSYDTLAGLVLRRLGRMAQVGDEVQVESVSPDGGQLLLRVTAMDRHRIDQVAMRPLLPAEQPKAARTEQPQGAGA